MSTFNFSFDDYKEQFPILVSDIQIFVDVHMLENLLGHIRDIFVQDFKGEHNYNNSAIFSAPYDFHKIVQQGMGKELINFF